MNSVLLALPRLLLVGAALIQAGCIGPELDVTLSGEGSGAVRSSPEGIDCGTVCATIVDPELPLVLTGTAAVGSTFAGWSGGGCVGTEPCLPELTVDTRIEAVFEIARYELVVSRVGSGTGTIVSAPGGIDCGEHCSEPFAHGTMVTLSATASPGSTFLGWSGDHACPGTGSCVIAMTNASGVEAVFAVDLSLVVTRIGNGTGTVTSMPGGIQCGQDCDEAYRPGTVVSLSATPSTDSRFSGWSGACSGMGPCSVTLDAARLVTATFTARDPHTLMVTCTGAGVVTSTPSGIDCNADCAEEYDSGTVVTLTASPQFGWTFSGWTGGCSGTIGTCTTTVVADLEIGATFTAIPQGLDVTLSGAGTGTVTSNPAGIACGSDCTAAFGYGTVVSLVATPSTGSVFAGWSGACAGSGGCIVTLDQAKAVGASFTRLTYPLSVTRVGAGVVTSSVAGIDCGADCTELYPWGTTVVLTASPGAGASFSGWSGGCTGTGPCSVTVSASVTLAATFAMLPVLTLTTIGGGVVTSAPTGINCGSDCSEIYPVGAVVVLSASPANGYSFSGWSGGCTGTGACSVTLSADVSVTATFATLPVLTLSTIGGGVVTSAPGGINCGADCSESYPVGAVVVLSASPSNGYSFSGWSGGCTGTGACSVTLSSSVMVTAMFLAPIGPAVTIGRINPSNLSPAGVSGLTFDGSPDPMVIDGFGRSMWRLDVQTAAVVTAFPLAGADQYNMRSLAFDGTRYLTSRGTMLSTANPGSGAVVDIGTMGQFNFSSLALHPGTGELWMVNDCANPACSSAQGAQLWKVNQSTGAAHLERDFSALGIGQATALTISPDGTFYVATLSTTGSASIWALDPVGGTATFVTDAGLALFTALAVSPSNGHLYGIEEDRSVSPRVWRLVEM